jgi:hypothetical protein
MFHARNADTWQFLEYSSVVAAPVVWWSEFLATDPEVPGSFPALPDFLRSSGSGTGFTQPRELL